jgi:hypothetical protein
MASAECLSDWRGGFGITLTDRLDDWGNACLEHYNRHFPYNKGTAWKTRHGSRTVLDTNLCVC